VNIHRPVLTVLLVLGALAGVLWGAGTPALAASNYSYVGSFGSAPANPNHLSSPAGIAIDQATGAVYVIDQGNNRVEKFNSEGDPENFLATGTNVLTGPAGETFELEGFTGGGNGNSDSTDGIAVDNSCYEHERATSTPLSATECEHEYPSNDDIYVSDTGKHVIDKFSATGAYIGSLTGTCALAGTCPPEPVVPFAGPPLYGIATDPSGNLWVYQSDKEVDEFTGTLENSFVTGWTFEPSAAPGFAVDTGDNVYQVRESGNVGEYTSQGSLLGLLECYCAKGLTTDSAGDLFVLHANGLGTSVAEYAAPAPSDTEPLHEFGATGEEPLQSAAGIAVASSTGRAYVADPIANNVKMYELGSAPPPPSTNTPTPVTATSVTFSGTLGSESSDFYFSYNEGASCTGAGAVTTPVDNGGGSGAANATESASVGPPSTRLTASTTYTVCLIAKNKFGASVGNEVEFTAAPPPPPTVVTGLAEGAARTTASLTGSVTPEGLETEYWFQYGTSELYGQRTAAFVHAGSGIAPEAIASIISELAPETTYHFRLVAENKDGTSYGQEQTFTTTARTPPSVTTAGASNIGINAATIAGIVQTQGLDVTYGFEIGTAAGSYGPATGLGTVGAGLTETVTLGLQNLQPATTYHYRIEASNLDGAEYGSDQSFTTPGIPSPLNQPPTAPLIAVPAIAFPAEPGKPSTTVKTLTKAQKLAKALKACKSKPKKQRASCVKNAEKQYGPTTKKKTNKKTRSGA
jgi:hypothetical protein